MNNLFNASAIILETVWYARPHINRTSENIHFNEIYRDAGEISPSSSEVARVSFAEDIYFCRGDICELLGMLDSGNQIAIIESLRMLIE